MRNIHHIYCDTLKPTEAGVKDLLAEITHVKLAGYRVVVMDLHVLGVVLQHCDISDVIFRNCNLSWARFFACDIKNVRFIQCNIAGMDLRACTGYESMTADIATIGFAPVPPCKGSGFFAYKNIEGTIVKLWIPPDAERSSATTRKCRASKAFVVGLTDGKDAIESTRYYSTTYVRGKWVYPDQWDTNRWHECSGGLHFLMTPEEAIEWEPRNYTPAVEKDWLYARVSYTDLDFGLEAPITEEPDMLNTSLY